MSRESKRRAIFLDRDGVINVNRPDNVTSWDLFRFEEGSLDALARLRASDFYVIVVSNQSGIGRGQMTLTTVDAIHARMISEIEQAGGRIDRIYYCPHTAEEKCACRKPSPQMLWRGRDEFALSLTHSFLIGDWIDDVRAAQSAEVVPLLVRTGRGERALVEMQNAGMALPAVFENLAAAVEWILKKT
ncbi:MAG: D-glycero-beta-D-manno-heptose 1,7-bisphosphate 7-phosphatase [Chloroflexi bacterium]|nr:D-glycero-beta-D-manno-heptose 1,7-bisphosphate 7-phosphatase [Chloroflexota bacterium]